MSDLKPCPFCEAALVWSDTYSEYHHPVAACILSGHKFKKGMIGQWNRRAIPAVQPHVNKIPKSEHDTNGLFHLTGDTLHLRCATAGCGQHVSTRYESDGIGSDYCEPCGRAIATLFQKDNLNA